MQRPAAPPIVEAVAVAGNKYIRCPLPPFSANADTLRQYNEGGAVPTRRVIPLPLATASGSGTTINNSFVQNSSGSGSGGGSSSGTTLKAVTAFVNVSPLSPIGVFATTVQMAKSFQLLQVTSSQPLEIRLYGTALAQVSDIARLTDNAPPFEINHVITDVVLDTAPYQWSWQNRICANADNPQTTTIYITIVNPSGSVGTSSASVAITYLPLES
jgi:hypothetical protein